MKKPILLLISFLVFLNILLWAIGKNIGENFHPRFFFSGISAINIVLAIHFYKKIILISYLLIGIAILIGILILRYPILINLKFR